MTLLEHPTWKIHDSSKLKSYVGCPRAYFFRYVLGWELDTPEVHKHFGTSWHILQEHLLLNSCNEKSMLEAGDLFEEKYREKFQEMTDGERAPKNPAFAKLAIPIYCKAWGKEKYEVLYTEIAGTVSIGKDRVLHFKMDSIVKNEQGLICSLEHKSGSQNSKNWRDSFKLSIQTGTYTHVLYCLYPVNEVYGVIINGAVFTKGKICECPRIPCRRTPEMMEVWLLNVNRYIDKIEADFDELANAKEEDIVLTAFTPTYNDCTSYSGCPYQDFCMTVSNPLRIAHTIPDGFRQTYWDPSVVEAKTRVTI